MTIIDEHGREISEEDGEILEDDGFQLLDVYDDDTGQRPIRPSWIATVSAGFKNEKGYPQASRDGIIYVSGDKERCSGLIAALERTGNKKLTIAFLSDNLGDFIIQRFTRRSTTSLEVYGDQHSLTEIVQEKDSEGKVKGAVHHVYLAGSAKYKELRKTCKVEVSVLFALAEWDGQRTAVTFPDGLGAYRLRFTSRNSLQAIVGKLEEIKARITRGRIAGVPFDLSITYRDVPSPTGQTRNVPVWTIEFRPPEAIRLTSGNVANLLAGALNEGQRLQVMLPAPRYDMADALADDQDVDLETADAEPSARTRIVPNPDSDSIIVATEESVEVLTSTDPPCDPRHWESAWFGTVKGTAFDSDEARRGFLLSYTDEACGSLREFLARARESEASALIAAIGREIEVNRTASRRAALEAQGFEPPTEKVLEHEAATAETAPTEKSKARLTAERNYETLMRSAATLDIDLVPYEVGADVADDELARLTGNLAAAVRTVHEKPRERVAS